MRAFALITCVISLSIGSTIYLLFRQKSLLMFRWIDFFGLGEFVNASRESTDHLRVYFEGWAINSLPFGLWLFSLQIAIKVIWANHTSTIKCFWLLVGPSIAISSELLQLAGVLPGTFDLCDLCVLVLSSIAGTLFPVR